jgi:hypothetical protein
VGFAGGMRAELEVMRYLDIEVRAHLPQGKNGGRVTTRSKAKSSGHFVPLRRCTRLLTAFTSPRMRTKLMLGS